MELAICILVLGLLVYLAMLIQLNCGIAKAEALGFMYDDGLSFKQNQFYARALCRTACSAADRLEATGSLPPEYEARLYEYGLRPTVIASESPYEIADICIAICKALKC